MTQVVARRLIVAASTLSLLVGCDSTTGPDDLVPPPLERTAQFLRITMLDETVLPGGTARLRLENLSSREIGYNLCFRRMERWTGERWFREEIEQPDVCPAVVFLLPPETEVTLETYVSEELGVGIYRFDFPGIGFLDEAEGTLPSDDRKSNSFQVVPGSPSGSLGIP